MKESEDMELKEALAEIERLKGVVATSAAENARLAEAVALRDASKIVGEIVHAESVKLPDASKTWNIKTSITRSSFPLIKRGSIY